jgi:hypothetical protein
MGQEDLRSELIAASAIACGELVAGKQTGTKVAASY